MEISKEDLGYQVTIVLTDHEHQSLVAGLAEVYGMATSVAPAGWTVPAVWNLLCELRGESTMSLLEQIARLDREDSDD
jgi:hypothetical protein